MNLPTSKPLKNEERERETLKKDEDKGKGKGRRVFLEELIQFLAALAILH